MRTSSRQANILIIKRFICNGNLPRIIAGNYQIFNTGPAEYGKYAESPGIGPINAKKGTGN
jgi:hypothetical protein